EISGNRGKYHGLSLEQRAAILAMAEAGVSERRIARKFSVWGSTMQRTKRRWEAHYTPQSLPRTSRPYLYCYRTRRLIYQSI
ncbi:hypothetical protein CC78DRAFT_462857, partial [Lojkania enalia]